MKEEFIGDLKYIDPRKLITENNSNDVENFFLVLSCIFNDLKGILLFETMLIEKYKKPEDEERNVHSGNYYGTLVYINKLMLSTINEFIIFLQKNINVFDDPEFKIILSKLPKTQSKYWNDMISYISDEKMNSNNFLKTIIKIRSNIGFHFDHSGTQLRKGYISRFFGQTTDLGSQLAYYSIGENIATTRFFFADAATSEYLSLAANKTFKEDSFNNKRTLDFYKETIEIIKIIFNITYVLLKYYMPYRRNQS